MLDPIRLTRQLIDIPSTTGNEYDVAVFVEKILQDLGFSCSRQEVAEQRFNILASAGGRPRVLLNTHLDTVPPFFASHETDEHIFGRGACDTKGIQAAMLAAAERLKNDGVRDFAMLLVVGEETDSAGAKTANEGFAEIGVEHCVVGEPTESRFVRASKGAFTAIVRFPGVAAHSAYPERGDSAVRKLVRAFDEIERADWGHDAVLGRGTVNIGVVHGGKKPNIVPDSAEMELMFRCVEPPETVRARLERIVAQFDGEIVRGSGNEPMHMVVPEGEEAVVVAFGTDIPHMRRLGKPLLYGPGSILDAHGAEEKIAKKDILAAVGVYEGLVKKLLKA